MSSVRISVVVPVRNMAASVGPCIESLLAQSYSHDLTEVIIVDNGSTDGTTEVISRYPVRRCDEPVPGAPAARNRGIAEATGDFVAFTDADCVPVRGWLSRFAAAIETGADVVAGSLAVLDPDASLLAAYSAAIGQYDQEATVHHPNFPYAATGNVAIRRSLLQSVGGFNSDFAAYDGAELFWRLSQTTRLNMKIEPRAMVFYRTRDSVAGLARQNFGYGLHYARFCRVIPDANHATRPTEVARRWATRVREGVTRLSAGASWQRTIGLWGVHLVRETSLAAGILAGRRRFISHGPR